MGAPLAKRLMWRLVPQGLTNPFRSEPVTLPADLGLGQRRVVGAVNLLGLVVAEEALEGRFVIGTLNPGMLQRDGAVRRAMGGECYGRGVVEVDSSAKTYSGWMTGA